MRKRRTATKRTVRYYRSGEEKNSTALILIACVIYAAMLISGLNYVGSVKERNYEKSIEYVKKGNYFLASEGFRELHLFNYKSFTEDVINGKDFDKYYKNSAVLYAYTQAVRAYSCNNHKNAARWLEVTPDEYNGELSDEIQKLKMKIEANENNFKCF